jgi:hypothetical protein
MKKIIFALSFFMISGICNAQLVENLYPSGKKILTDNAAANFEKGKKYVQDKNNMSDADWNYVEKLGYNEMFESYWDILGGGCSWYCGNGGPVKIEASSRLKNQGNNNYDEKNLHDLFYNTAWVDGVSGDGVGEWVKYTFEANSPRITDIHVVNGYVKSQIAWKNNSRVKKLKVYVNDKPFAILNLEDSRSDQTFKIAPLNDNKQWTMKFEILEVYKGDKYDDTVLSEIYFDGLDVHCFAAGTKILLADNSTKNIEDIKQGDKVVCFNSITNKKDVATVEKTVAVKHNNMIIYVFEDGGTITATDDHPFFTERGWASSNPSKTANYNGFENVAKIKIGDKFITKNGSLKLVSTSISSQIQQTYTIEKLSLGNAFYANDILVGTEEINPNCK